MRTWIVYRLILDSVLKREIVLEMWAIQVLLKVRIYILK